MFCEACGRATEYYGPSGEGEMLARAYAKFCPCGKKDKERTRG